MKGSGLQWAVVAFITVAGVAFFIGFVASGGLDDDGSANVQATAAPTAPPTQRPEPTEYVPRLTGAEAAATAMSTFRAAVLIELLPFPPNFSCSAEDFNVRERAWIVECQGEGASLIYRVLDATGTVEVVGVN